MHSSKSRCPRGHAAGIIVACLLASMPAQAATYYVASNGSDSHPGTQAAPFRQIRKGISVAAPGDTILVADGTYLGFDVSGKSGTSSAPITLRATGSNAQVMKTTDRSDNRDTMYITYSDYWVLDGLRSFSANRAAVRLDHAHNITVRNCVFGNNATWGIFTNNSDDSLFENNECYGSVSQHGIYVSNSSMRPVVRGNRLHDNAQCGLHMNGDLSMGPPGIIDGALVENNVIWANGAAGGAGINMDGPQNTVVRNNLIFGNVAGGITAYDIDAAEGPRNVRILNNTVDMPSTGRWALLIAQTAGLVTVKNNILLHANTARGGLLYATAADVSNTDSDYNILDRVTPNDGSTVYSLSQWQSMGHEPHSFAASAFSLFVNAPGGDYHLRLDSPAIDRGTDAGVSSDLEGNPRPAVAGYDVGCYEAASSNPPPSAPALSSLNPPSATAGGPAFTLTVTGAGFLSGATVNWNGSPRTTTVDSSTQVRTAITSADIASAGTALVTAYNPGSMVSNALTFTITPSSPADAQLQTLSLSPSTVVETESSTGTVTISSAAPSGGIVITLSSSTNKAVVPSTVTVPAGASSATFIVTTRRVRSDRTATITAVYRGASASATLTILSAR